MSEQACASRRTCPRCGYDAEGLPSALCPECGVDIEAATRRAMQWCRGAGAWLKVGLGVLGLCALATFATGVNAGSLTALVIEGAVSLVGFSLIYLFFVHREEGDGRIRGMLGRCAVPVVLFPITSAAIWASYGSLLASRGFGWDGMARVGHLLNGIELGATLGLLAWLVAAVVVSTKSLALNWFTLEGLRAAAALVGMVVLGFVVTVISSLPLVGGDGMGP